MDINTNCEDRMSDKSKDLEAYYGLPQKSHFAKNAVIPTNVQAQPKSLSTPRPVRRLPSLSTRTASATLAASPKRRKLSTGKSGKNSLLNC